MSDPAQPPPAAPTPSPGDLLPDPGPGKRKRGTRGAVNEQRLQLVEDALGSGWSHQLIYRTYCATWACSRRTLRRYITRVYNRWREDAPQQTAEDRTAQRERIRVLLLDQYQKADQRQDHRSAAQIATRLAQLDGLVVTRHELSGPDGKPLQVEDPRADLERRIADIVARRRTGGGPGDTDAG